MQLPISLLSTAESDPSAIRRDGGITSEATYNPFSQHAIVGKVREEKEKAA